MYGLGVREVQMPKKETPPNMLGSCQYPLIEENIVELKE